MDLELIKKIIKIAEESDISGLSVEQGDFKVDVRREKGQVVQIPHNQAVLHTSPVPTAQAHGHAVPAPEEEGLVPIVSPMVGTFYRSPSPDSPPFVDVGDEINTGKVVCIIEAMKLFNEIEAEVKGTVAKILVENGQPVEYGQKLFLIRK